MSLYSNINGNTFLFNYPNNNNSNLTSSITPHTKSSNKSQSPSQNKYKKIGNYLLSSTIGMGTFSKVKLGVHIPTKENVAIKILDKSHIKDNSDIQRIQREIYILKKLRHQNIAQLYETITSERHIYIVMEYIPGKDLFQYIYSLGRLDEKKSSLFFRQLIITLEYIHSNGIVHRDIKPENILLNLKKNRIKIVDFGLSNTYKPNELLSTACGSPCYAAPEMISGKKYKGLKSDIWSSGVVLYCMLAGKLPFDDIDLKTLYKKIKGGEYVMPNFISDYAQDILRKILCVNPEKRIDINEIKKHKFFNFDKTPLYDEIDFEEGIKVDCDVVRYIKEKFYKDKEKVDEDFIMENIVNNEHNTLTTLYYLLLKKKKRFKDDDENNFFNVSYNKTNNNSNNNYTSSNSNNKDNNNNNNNIIKEKKIFNLGTVKKINLDNLIGKRNNNNNYNNIFNLKTFNTNIITNSKNSNNSKNSKYDNKYINTMNANNNLNNILNTNNNSGADTSNNKFNVFVINNFVTEPTNNNNNINTTKIYDSVNSNNNDNTINTINLIKTKESTNIHNKSFNINNKNNINNDNNKK